MMHIQEDIFYQWIFERVAASEPEQAHLGMCAACQAQWDAMQILTHEFQITRASEPTDAALTRYFQLFDQVQPAPSLAQRLTEFIIAQLQWDGRQQPAWQGVRNAQVASYRLLYALPQAEIELLIAPQEGQFQIEGEMVTLEESTTLLPALCELHDVASGAMIVTTECEASGRFRLGTVPAGRYQVYFVPASGATSVIHALELA